MPKMIATCGHGITPRWFDSGEGNCAWKEISADYTLNKNVSTISYGVLCSNCKWEYKDLGLLLENVEEEETWLEDK